MKSSFLLSVFLVALSTQVWGQTSTAASTDKTANQKFMDRLSISYFGVFTSPTLEDFNAANAAISPEYGDTGKRCRKNCDTYAMNLWNQVNFGYNFGARMKFNIIPRFTIMMANPRDMGAPEDRAMINLEDALVGFSGVVYQNDAKTFSWWMRPGVRLPTSRFSRNYDHPAFGTISYQPEWVNTFTWDPSKTWQYGVTVANRVWVFEDRFNNSRHRIITNPWVSYAVSDSTKVQAYFEHFLENNKNYKSINGKEPNYMDVWQNLMIGVAQDVTPKLNVMPFISAFVNDVPFSTRSMWIGTWISYSIK